MKTLLLILTLTLLLTLSFTVQAGYKTVYVCDSRGNCEYITILDNAPTYNPSYDADYESDDDLLDSISNSGAKNYNQYQRNYDQARDRK